MRGDMSSRADLERLIGLVGGAIDVLIDDASHASHHQQFALAHLIRHLRPGGMYIIEDLWWQPEDLEQSGVPKTRDLLREFQVSGKFRSPVLTAEQRQVIEENLGSVLLFDSLTRQCSDPTDSLAVLVKKL